MLEEAIACFGNVLGTALQYVHDADDGRQRRAQLVSGVLDELALALARALAFGDVVDDQDRGFGCRRRNPFDPEEMVVGLDKRAARRGIGAEKPRREVTERELRPRIV